MNASAIDCQIEKLQKNIQNCAGPFYLRRTVLSNEPATEKDRLLKPASNWFLSKSFSQNLDYLVFDYLSEVTMSLLTAAHQKNPDLGFAPDFVLHAIGPYLKDIKNKGS